MIPEETLNEEISTSVTSPIESSEILTETTPSPSDLVESTKKSEIDEPTCLVNNTQAYAESLQIQECTESEKSEPETSGKIESFTEKTDDSKNEAAYEIVSSVGESQTDNVEQPSETVSEESDMGNVADSSTSQEEVSKSEVKQAIDEDLSVEKFPEDEPNSIDEPTTDGESGNVDVPMEVDIVTDSKDKVSPDEPSSTSTDNNF